MPMSPDEHARENGFSDAKSMREYTEEFGTIEVPLTSDTVVLSREKYLHLLWLTTPKPIEAGLTDYNNVLMTNLVNYCQGFRGETGDYYESLPLSPSPLLKFKPTHWLPLPNTPPIPKPSAINELSDDAQDALRE